MVPRCWLVLSMLGSCSLTLYGQAPPLLITGGQLIDGASEKSFQGSVIVVEDGRIAAIHRRPPESLPSDAVRIDARGKTILPGLIDLYVHITLLGEQADEEWTKKYAGRTRDIIPLALSQLLLAGVTSARDSYVPLDDAVWTLTRVESGAFPAPRLFLGGPGLDPGRPGSGEVGPLRGIRDLSTADALVDEWSDHGLTHVSILHGGSFPLHRYRQMVDAARRRGLHVAATYYREADLARAAQAGVDLVEFMGEGRERALSKETLRLISKRAQPLYVVPTFVSYRNYLDAQRDPLRLDDPRTRASLPAEIFADLRRSLEGVAGFAYTRTAERASEAIPGLFGQLRRRGVRTLIGTASGSPLTYHTDSIWREMEIWQELGVEPMEVLKSATSRSADFLGRPDLGRLAPGALADIVIVDGNPLENLRDMRQVDTVIVGGRVTVLAGLVTTD